MPPMYDYLCTKGHETEVEQRITEEPLDVCPARGCRAKTKRLISRTSFHLKGNGWYASGYSGPSNVAPSTKKDKNKAGGASTPPKSKNK